MFEIHMYQKNTILFRNFIWMSFWICPNSDRISKQFTKCLYHY